MYLKLGNTTINYTSPRLKFIVLGQIIHSMMGYESPVLVQSVDELDIWFGTRFKERNWMVELLKTSPDISLLLSPPLSSESFKKGDDYIDYHSFPIDPNPYYNTLMLPDQGKENTIYRILLDGEGKSYEDWIWTGSFYISVQDLPQNQDPDSSSSLFLRDTLMIGKVKSEEDWIWCHPEFKKELEENKIELDLEKINLEELEDETRSLVFNLKLPFDDQFSTTNYLVLKETIYWTGNGAIPPINDRYFEKNSHVISRENLIEELEKDGWLVEMIDKDNITLKIGEGVKVTYFYSWPTLEIIPDYKFSQQILTQAIDPSQNIYFWSKTIGRPQEAEWEDDNIHLKIEKITDNRDEKWRITVWRYNYLEVFEGTLSQSPNRIDYVIERGSKLIHAYIPESVVLEKLLEGEWQLRGANILRSSDNPSLDLRNTIKWLLREDRQYFPDFFMIPNPEEWMNESNYLQIYQEWLEISKNNSFQFLIQNTQENLKWNYTKDLENKLVWFYNPIYVNREERPGYYLFLLGLFQDIYSMTAQNILYNLPVKNPYLENDPIEKTLAEYKSNYLVCNNQIYYYKEYQNGSIYDTSILMRFVMWKISRELYKNMDQYLGSQIVGEIIEAINGVLLSVKNRFKIIRNIEISNYNISFAEQKINLTIDTTISDIKNNNMTLDLIINYNKSEQ